MPIDMRLISIVVLTALTCAVQAATLTGRVVAVADGDSVTVLDADKVRHKVRLQAIDAPEKGQAFGNRSKQHLGRLLLHKDVSVQWRKRDRYGRIVGKLMVQSPDCPRCPKNLDAGQAQLSVGLAWWYRKHAHEQSPDDRGRYESEEREARARRVGLWRDAAPMPPWEFRKAKQVAHVRIEIEVTGRQRAFFSPPAADGLIESGERMLCWRAQRRMVAGRRSPAKWRARPAVR